MPGLFSNILSMSLSNNYPGNQLYTKAELAAFINTSGSNYISWACARNPAAVYNYILRNYPMFGRMGNGQWTTDDGIYQMYDFLCTEYTALPAAQQPHWLLVLGSTLPKTPQLKNWANPKN